MNISFYIPESFIYFHKQYIQENSSQSKRSLALGWDILKPIESF